MVGMLSRRGGHGDEGLGAGEDALVEALKDHFSTRLTHKGCPASYL